MTIDECLLANPCFLAVSPKPSPSNPHVCHSLTLVVAGIAASRFSSREPECPPVAVYAPPERLPARGDQLAPLRGI